MEVAMNDTPSLASAPHQAIRPDMSRRRLDTLRSMIATWDERIRVRWELQQMSAANPHLIDDLGLTKRQVEAEITKTFWRA
jgi:uncharacterized protein YjiS (DUF1127 family)